MTDQRRPAPQCSVNIAGDAIHISLPDERAVKLTHQAIPQPSPETSRHSDRKTDLPKGTLIFVTDFAAKLDHCIVDNSGSHTHGDSFKYLLKAAAWILLSQVLSRTGIHFVPGSSDFASLNALDSRFPEPAPHVIPLNESHAIPISSLPAEIPPLIADPVNVLHRNNNRYAKPTACGLHSLYKHRERLPWTLVKNCHDFHAYSWWRKIPELMGMSFPGHPAQSAVLKRIRARISFATPEHKTDSKARHVMADLPWCLSSPDVLWVTPGNTPSVAELTSILHASANHDRYNHTPHPASDAHATKLLASVGMPPSPEQLQDTADELRGLARDRLPPGYTADIRIVRDPEASPDAPG